MTPGTDWGKIARFSLIGTLVAAIVLFFALPDQRWIAALVLGAGLIDLLVIWRVLPALAGSKSATGTDTGPSSDPARLGEEPEVITPIKDGDWGVPPPSEPSHPDRDA